MRRGWDLRALRDILYLFLDPLVSSSSSFFNCASAVFLRECYDTVLLWSTRKVLWTTKLPPDYPSSGMGESSGDYGWIFIWGWTYSLNNNKAGQTFVKAILIHCPVNIEVLPCHQGELCLRMLIRPIVRIIATVKNIDERFECQCYLSQLFVQLFSIRVIS